MKLIAGWMMPEMNCALKLAWNSSSFSSSNFSDGLLLAAEHLHDVAARVHLLDVAVERAGALPLRRELLLRALRDGMVTTTESGTVSSEIAASSGLIQNIIASTPMTVSTAVMICVRLCCSVWRCCRCRWSRARGCRRAGGRRSSAAAAGRASRRPGCAAGRRSLATCRRSGTAAATRRPRSAGRRRQAASSIRAMAAKSTPSPGVSVMRTSISAICCAWLPLR